METLSPESETDSYARGFYDKCAGLGIDPEAVLQGHTLQSIVPEVLGAATLAPIVKAAAEHGFDLDAYMLKTGQAQAAPTLNRQAQLANLRRRASASPTYNPGRQTVAPEAQNKAYSSGLPAMEALDAASDMANPVKQVKNLYQHGAVSALKTNLNNAGTIGKGVLDTQATLGKAVLHGADAFKPQAAPAAKPAAPAVAKPVAAAPVAAAQPAVKPPVAAAPVPAAQPAAKPQPQEGKMFGVPESQWNKMKRPEQQQAEAAVAKERGKPYVYNMQPGANGGPAVPNYKAAAAQGFYDVCIKAGLQAADVEALVMSKYGQAQAAPTTPDPANMSMKRQVDQFAQGARNNPNYIANHPAPAQAPTNPAAPAKPVTGETNPWAQGQPGLGTPVAGHGQTNPWAQGQPGLGTPVPGEVKPGNPREAMLAKAFGMKTPGDPVQNPANKDLVAAKPAVPASNVAAAPASTPAAATPINKGNTSPQTSGIQAPPSLSLAGQAPAAAKPPAAAPATAAKPPAAAPAPATAAKPPAAAPAPAPATAAKPPAAAPAPATAAAPAAPAAKPGRMSLQDMKDQGVRGFSGSGGTAVATTHKGLSSQPPDVSVPTSQTKLPAQGPQTREAARQQHDVSQGTNITPQGRQIETPKATGPATAAQGGNISKQQFDTYKNQKNEEADRMFAQGMGGVTPQAANAKGFRNPTDNPVAATGSTGARQQARNARPSGGLGGTRFS